MNADASNTVPTANAQMRKGILEFCIMLIIHRGKSMYASDILKELQRIDMIVVEGTVYPLLNRLRRDGVLDYTWEESQSGPPRKYYHITPKGKSTLKELTASWKSLSRSITSLLQSNA